MDKLAITPQDVMKRLRELHGRLAITRCDVIYGVPRGGIPLAFGLAGLVGCDVTDSLSEATFVIDDLIDSGNTRKAIMSAMPSGCEFVALYDKPTSPFLMGRWLAFPWEEKPGGEGNESAEDIFVRLIQFIGQNVNSEDLRETPARAARAWKEWTAGYGQKPADVLKVFNAGGWYDEMIVVKGIPIMSTCEHHLAPIIGKAAFGYIPGKEGKIVGLSKIPRLFEIYARRLQLQERLTRQVGDAFMSVVEPLGCGVRIEAEHMCMASRGVRVHGATTVTSSLHGVFKTDARARAEFMELCK